MQAQVASFHAKSTSYCSVPWLLSSVLDIVSIPAKHRSNGLHESAHNIGDNGLITSPREPPLGHEPTRTSCNFPMCGPAERGAAKIGWAPKTFNHLEQTSLLPGGDDEGIGGLVVHLPRVARRLPHVQHGHGTVLKRRDMRAKGNMKRGDLETR